MTRTLNATLQTAQNSTEHNPAIKLISEDFVSAIPFDGNDFTFDNTFSYNPRMLYMSSGRIAAIMQERTAESPLNDSPVYLLVTNENRTIWETVVDIKSIAHAASPNSYMIWDTTLVELPNGDIGIVFVRKGNQLTTYGLFWGVVDVDGNIKTYATTINAGDSDKDFYGIHCYKFSNGTYYLTYARRDENDDPYTWGIWYSTATTFGSFGSETQITLSGLDDEHKTKHPCVLETDEGDIFLLFDYVDAVDGENEIANIYSAISTDWGVTWGTPSARTTYSSYGTSGFNPVCLQKSNGTVYLVYYEQNTVLVIDDVPDQTTTGGGCPSGFGGSSLWDVMNLHYHPSTNELVMVVGNSSFSHLSHNICAVHVIDVDTWSIVRGWHDQTTPNWNSWFSTVNMDESYWQSFAGTKFVCGKGDATGAGSGLHILVLDFITGAMIEYSLGTSSWPGNLTYGLYKNGDLTFPEWDYDPDSTTPTLIAIKINTAGDKVYMFWCSDYFDAGMWVSMIDITESPDESGDYSVTWPIQGYNNSYDRYELLDAKNIYIDDDYGYIICYGGSPYYDNGTWLGFLVIFSQSSGAMLYEWRSKADSDFHWNGIEAWSTITLYNNRIYANITWYDHISYENMRGLMRINLLTEGIDYLRPSYADENVYYLRKGVIDETNQRIFFTASDGIAMLELSGSAWGLYNGDNVPGLITNTSPSSSPTMMSLTYDEDTGSLFTGWGYIWPDGYPSLGVRAFNVSGVFTQVHYLTATKSGTWSWDTEPEALVADTTSLEPAIAIDEDDLLWCIWSDFSFITNLYTPKWDRDLGEYEITDDIHGQVTIVWDVKKPNTLTFTLAQGHLYDPINTLSLLRDIVKKGRKLTLSLGEIVDSTAYYDQQGEFIVIETSTDFKRRDYPRISVRAESASSLWKDQNVIATETFTTISPDVVLETILTDNAMLDAGEFDIPTFVKEHDITHTFIDMDVWDIVEELLDHWFYIPYDNHDGIFTILHLDLDKDVDHAYNSNNDHLIEFTPDDTYSDFTNQITVIGESENFYDVVFNEELIESIAGTVGWWENKITHTVNYSADRSRQCIDPRLYIVQSISLQGMFMDVLSSGGGSETISYEDPESTYLIISIDVPDLSYALAASIAVTLGFGLTAIMCIYDCGLYIFSLTIALSITFYILAAIANYQYEIWARPIGKERQSIQYTDDDYTHQRSLDGRVISKKLEDSMCYEVLECRRVAEGNMDIVQAQRNRLRIKKATHLQDELLDKITMYHPYSGEAMDIIITKLTRIYSKGKSGMLDTIEGWRIM